jgi:hypothetical protein
MVKMYSRVSVVRLDVKINSVSHYQNLIVRVERSVDLVETVVSYPLQLPILNHRPRVCTALECSHPRPDVLSAARMDFRLVMVKSRGACKKLRQSLAIQSSHKLD